MKGLYKTAIMYVCCTHMTTVAPQPRSHEVLDALDSVLVSARRWGRGPGYRRRIWELLSSDVELATIRVLRAVEASASSTGESSGPSIGDVARALSVDASTASRFVDRVVERGELDRRRSREDRRRTELSLTESGEGLLSDVTRTRRTVLKEVTDGWDAADLAELVRLMRKLDAGFLRLEKPNGG